MFQLSGVTYQMYSKGQEILKCQGQLELGPKGRNWISERAGTAGIRAWSTGVPGSDSIWVQQKLLEV